MFLAEEMRPTSLDEVIGQRHLLGTAGVLRKLVNSGHVANMIFYGPPGVGKTTVAKIIAETSGLQFRELIATKADAEDFKQILNDPDEHILLYLDEIQYLNKRQQQTLLADTESGHVTLLGATTENPYFCLHRALVSRCAMFEFKDISTDELQSLVMRAFVIMTKKTGIAYTVEQDALEAICGGCGGDVRSCLNTVEVLASLAEEKITLELVHQVTQASGLSCMPGSSEQYALMSALQKSIRGSDPDAAVYYTARLLAGGCLETVCRRLMVIAAEDVGLAYPLASAVTKACVDSALQLGMPEAQIPLAEAVLLLATSPKSNSACKAIDAAMSDLSSGKVFEIPSHLINTGPGARGYKYPHDFPNHYVKQQYLPTQIADKRYYVPGDNKFEQGSLSYWDKIK